MTQSEFIKMYCKNSNLNENKLNEFGIFAIPCECKENGCDGWKMVSKQNFTYQQIIY